MPARKVSKQPQLNFVTEGYSLELYWNVCAVQISQTSTTSLEDSLKLTKEDGWIS